MNFFRGAKKAEENPVLPRPGPLSFGPGAPAAPSLSNAGTAFPSPPEAAQLFPYSFNGRNCPRYPPPDAALSFFPRRALLCPLSPTRDRSCSPFPPVGGTGLALCPERKRASAPLSPSAGRGDRAAPPRQKQKARPPPKGWPDRCVSLSGDEAQVSDQALGLPNWQSLLPESEVHISSMFRGSL